jgi:hypothetical protein
VSIDTVRDVAFLWSTKCGQKSKGVSSLMVHFHVPESLALIGMTLGVAVAPLIVIGTLFLVVRAIVGG